MLCGIFHTAQQWNIPGDQLVMYLRCKQNRPTLKSVHTHNSEYLHWESSDVYCWWNFMLIWLQGSTISTKRLKMKHHFIYPHSTVLGKTEEKAYVNCLSTQFGCQLWASQKKACHFFYIHPYTTKFTHFNFANRPWLTTLISLLSHQWKLLTFFRISPLPEHRCKMS